MDRFVSEAQWFSLGLVPPRTPERADAQVPTDAASGPARYGRCSHLYFRSSQQPEDVAFGFLDLEVSIQLRRNGEVQLELYCIGDGFQAGRGCGKDEPLRLEIWGGNARLDSVAWHYPLLVCDQLDPLAFSAPTALTADEFSRADRVFIPSVPTAVHACRSANPASAKAAAP